MNELIAQASSTLYIADGTDIQSPFFSDNAIYILCLSVCLTIGLLAYRSWLKDTKRSKFNADAIPGVAFSAQLKPNGDLDFQYLSNACVELFNQTANEIRKSEAFLKNITVEEDKPLLDNALENALKMRQAWDLEIRILSQGNEIKYVSISAKPQSVSKKRIVYSGLITDISNSKANELDLQESESRYRQLVDLAPIGILMHCHDKVVYANQKTLELLGLENSEDIVDQTIWHFVHKDSFSEAKSQINRTYNQNELTRLVEQRFVRADRTTIDVEVMATMITYHGQPAAQIVFSDITKRKQAEATLVESEQRLELALQGGNLGIWDCNFKTGTVILNQHFWKITGHDPDKMTIDCANWHEFIHPDDLKSFYETWENHHARKTDYYSFEYRILAKDQKWIWILDSGKIVERDANGEAVRAVGTHLDITERKAAEQAIIEAKDEAETANKSKDQFLSIMSHEMRTPLNPILGFTSLMLNETQNKEHKNYLNIINESGKQLHNLIKDILEFAKMDSGHNETNLDTFELNTLCRNAIVMTLPILRNKEIMLEANIINDIDGTGRLFVEGDSQKIRQIIINFLANACKFTEKGSIRLQCKCIETNGPIGTFQFQVIDTGIGIPTDRINELFSPFVQLDSSYTREYDGIGLGLAICKRLSDSLQGEIQAESKPGAGSTFSFTVPLRIKQSAPVAPIKSIQTEPIGKSINPKILLVEDNQSNIEYTQYILDQIGATTTIAHNGEEAIAAFKQNTFDLVFMDIEMPIIDGLETTRTLRKLSPPGSHTPIVALTAHIAAEQRSGYIEIGMDDCLGKPFFPDDIENVLQKWLPASLV